MLKVAPDLQFEWFTTSPVATDGVRTVAAGTLAGAMTNCECYQGAEWGPRGDATALWLSRAAYLALASGARTILPFDDNESRQVQTPAFALA